MFERCSILARQAVFFARGEAGQTGAASIDTEHLLIGILAVHPELAAQLAIEIDAASVRIKTEQSHPPRPAIPNSVDLPITPELGRVLEHAISIADGQQCQEIRTEHFVASIFEEGGHAARILADFQLEEKAISNLIAKVDCSVPQEPTEASHRAISAIMGRMAIESDDTPES
jgi:ATP-dependent Clp protease ATP-binding subunit ClpA